MLILLKKNLCISWCKNFDNIKMHGKTVKKKTQVSLSPVISYMVERQRRSEFYQQLSSNKTQPISFFSSLLSFHQQQQRQLTDHKSGV